jgi:hypothetical protein
LEHCANTAGAPTSSIESSRNVAGLVTRQSSVAGTGPFTRVVSTWSFDPLGRMTSQATVKGATNQLVVRQDYAYLGNDDPKTLHHWLGANNHKQFDFGYDRRHQLETATEVTTPRYFEAHYAYGADGRFRAATEDSTLPKGSNVIPRAVAYQYGGLDPEQVTALIDTTKQRPLMSYAYDRAGNQTLLCWGALTGTSCSGKSVELRYDGANQLRRTVSRNGAGKPVGSEEYWYDHTGNRTHIVKRDAAGNKTEMIWFIGAVEAHYTASGANTKVLSHVTFGPVAARFERSEDAPSTL